MTAQHIMTSVLEDYLENIFFLVKEHNFARVKDIAERMKVKMSTVTSALKRLSQMKLVNYDPYSVVTLTKEGEGIASKIASRHRILTDFFTKILSVPADIAQENACKVEHVIDETLLKRFVLFAKFIDNCPQINLKWSEDKGYCCNARTQNCLSCELATLK